MSGFQESELWFDAAAVGSVFRIETDILYTSCGKGVRVVDFCVLTKENAGGRRTLLLVEAKASLAQSGDAESFQKLIRKFHDSLAMLVSARTGLRTSAAFLPEPYASAPLDKLDVDFVVVVAKTQRGWLPAQLDLVRKVLSPVARAWGLKPARIRVLDSAGAAAWGLISAADA